MESKRGPLLCKWVGRGGVLYGIVVGSRTGIYKNSKHLIPCLNLRLWMPAGGLDARPRLIHRKDKKIDRARLSWEEGAELGE